MASFAPAVGPETAILPLLASELYGVRPFDAMTLTAVPALLLLIATAACAVPARRAMATDPVHALRH